MNRDAFERLQALSGAVGSDTAGPSITKDQVQSGMQFGFDVVEVSRVGLQPGDVLMVTVKNNDLSQESVDALRMQLSLVFPNNKVFVFAMGTSDDVNLSIVSQTTYGSGGGCGVPLNNDLANPASVGYCDSCNCGKKEAALSEIDDEHMKLLAKQAIQGE